MLLVTYGDKVIYNLWNIIGFFIIDLEFILPLLEYHLIKSCFFFINIFILKITISSYLYKYIIIDNIIKHIINILCFGKSITHRYKKISLLQYS
jgi:hypothetical protein